MNCCPELDTILHVRSTSTPLQRTIALPRPKTVLSLSLMACRRCSARARPAASSEAEGSSKSCLSHVWLRVFTAEISTTKLIGNTLRGELVSCRFGIKLSHFLCGFLPNSAPADVQNEYSATAAEVSPASAPVALQNLLQQSSSLHSVANACN